MQNKEHFCNYLYYIMCLNSFRIYQDLNECTSQQCTFFDNVMAYFVVFVS